MNLAKLFIGLGAILIGVGFVIWLAQKILGLDRLGRLPGDIRIERENFKFYFPIATCLILSLIITVLVRIFQGWRK